MLSTTYMEAGHKDRIWPIQFAGSSGPKKWRTYVMLEWGWRLMVCNPTPTTLYCLVIILREEIEEERLRSSSCHHHCATKNTGDRNLEMTLQCQARIEAGGTEFWTVFGIHWQSVRVWCMFAVLLPERTLNESQNCSRIAHSDRVRLWESRLYGPSKNLGHPNLFCPEQRSICGGPLGTFVWLSASLSGTLDRSYFLPLSKTSSLRVVTKRFDQNISSNVRANRRHWSAAKWLALRSKPTSWHLKFCNPN